MLSKNFRFKAFENLKVKTNKHDGGLCKFDLKKKALYFMKKHKVNEYKYVMIDEDYKGNIICKFYRERK